MNAAVNRSIARRTQEGETVEEERPADAVLYASEALTLKSAINAWTSGAAWASFDEHRKGMIKAGMLADLVVLSSDILTGTPEKLATTEVDVTIFDGKVVYQRGNSHATRPTNGRERLVDRPPFITRRTRRRAEMSARGIAVDGDQVREQSRLDLTDRVTPCAGRARRPRSRSSARRRQPCRSPP